MTEKRQWKRPQDIETFRTSDTNEMVGKYLPRPVIKTYNEDFMDDDTKEVITIERSEVLVDQGHITKELASTIAFFIASGDIKDVEVCEDPVLDMTLYTSGALRPYSVEIHNNIGEKSQYIAHAQTLAQAIRIATEFAQVYKGLCGWVSVSRVVVVNAVFIPDDDKCIPEDERKSPELEHNYFKVQVRTEWEDELTGAPKKRDRYFVIAAEEVGEAKERMARWLDITAAESKERGEGDAPGDKVRRTIRKATPFEAECIVPREFSELYHEEPTK